MHSFDRIPLLAIALGALVRAGVTAEEPAQGQSDTGGVQAAWSPRAAGLVPVANYRPPRADPSPAPTFFRRPHAVAFHPSVLSIVDRPPSTSYPRRLPSYARVVPATGSRASLSAAYLPQVQLGLTVLTRATVFRALPDIPLPVFEASIYLLPRGPAAPRFACPGPAVIRRATGFAACFETDLLRQ